MADKGKPKDHADFQDNYRRSSNFNSNVKDENFEIEGDGELKIDKSKEKLTDISEDDKKRIADAMDSFQQRIEITPGGEQSDGDDEE